MRVFIVPLVCPVKKDDRMIKNAESIEHHILEKITPSTKEHEHLMGIVKDLIDAVRSEIDKLSVNADVELVGSTAKNTYLIGNMDIDVFLVFSPEISAKLIAKTALDIGRAILKNPQICYAQHPYINGEFRGIKGEIVPCYRINDAREKISAVDRTPLHTKYVLANLAKRQNDEVRLFKRFLKGIGCYGAEAEIEGFSGYLCELLTLRYGTLDGILESACMWQPKERLTLTEDSGAPFESTLIFIDPVDPSRNVASALSRHRFDVFTDAARCYSMNPSESYFFPNAIKPWSLEKISDGLSTQNLVALCFPRPLDIIAENLYPQVRKSLRLLVELCERFDFCIQDSWYHIGNKKIWLIIHPKEEIISDTAIHNGPPSHIKDNSREFIEKWEQSPRTVRGPRIKDGRWFVEIQREHVDIRDALKDEMGKISLGKDIDKNIKEHAKILEKSDLINESLKGFWTEILDGLRPWER